MPKVSAVIFCDQCRVEENGKYILIGTYTGKMGANNFPQQFSLQPVLLMDEISAGTRVRVRISSESGAKFAEYGVEAAIDPSSVFPGILAWLPSPLTTISLSEADVIEVSAAFDDGDFAIVGRLPVELLELEDAPAE